MNTEGLRLIGPGRAGRNGAWWRATMDGVPRGALRVDPALFAAPGARDWLVAAQVRLAQSAPAGVLPAQLSDPQGHDLWLVTAIPADPTVDELLRAAALPSSGLLTIAGDLALAVQHLHEAGLAHGSLGLDTAVLDGSGRVLLAEAAVRPGTPAADAAALADVLITLAGVAGTTEPAAAARLQQCANAARTAGPAAVLSALANASAIDPQARAGIAAVARRAGALRRPAALEATMALSDATVAIGGAAADDPSVATIAVRTPGPMDMTVSLSGATTDLGGTVVLADSTMALDDATVATAAFHATRPAETVLPVETVRSVETLWPVETARPVETVRPAETMRPATGPPARTLPHQRVGGGPPPLPARQPAREFRFGPGIPPETVEAWRRKAAGLPPAVPAPAPAKPRRRGRLVAALVTLVVLGGVGGYLWVRTHPGFTVTSVAVEVTGQNSPDPEACAATVDVAATIDTNGHAGTIAYQWERSDGVTVAPQRVVVPSGARSTTVHLLWAVAGPGNLTGVATLKVSDPNAATGSGSFTFQCG